VPAPAAIGEAGPCGAPSTPEEAQEEVAAGPAAGYGMFPAASSPPQPLECKLRRRSKKEGPPPAPDAQVAARLGRRRRRLWRCDPRRLFAVWRRSSPPPSFLPPERGLRRSSWMGAAAGSCTSVTVDEGEPALPPPTALLLRKMEVRASPRKEKHGPHRAHRRVHCSGPRSSGSPASERRRAQVLATEERTVRAGR
jgi:hypothetical protein